MTHEEFLEKIRKGLGPVLSVEARPRLAELVQSRGFEICLRYDWIKDDRIYSWPDSKIVDFSDGAETITFFVYEEHREE